MSLFYLCDEVHVESVMVIATGLCHICVGRLNCRLVIVCTLKTKSLSERITWTLDHSYGWRYRLVVDKLGVHHKNVIRRIE